MGTNNNISTRMKKLFFITFLTVYTFLAFGQSSQTGYMTPNYAPRDTDAVALWQWGHLYNNGRSGSYKFTLDSLKAYLTRSGFGGAGTVTSVSQGFGITNTPNPIVGAGTVKVDTARSTGLPTKHYVDSLVSTAGGSGWSLTGNAGTNPPTDFIGTTDTAGVNISRNSVPYIKIESNSNPTIRNEVSICDSLGNKLIQAFKSSVSAVGVNVSLGDVSSVYNLTNLYINDGAKTIECTDSAFINAGIFTNVGAVTIQDGTQGSNKVLTSDASGNASWTGNIARYPYSLFDHYTDAGNVSTSETDLYADTIAANQLSTNGDKLEGRYTVTLNVGAMTQAEQIRVYWDGNLIWDTGANTMSQTDQVDISFILIRESATILRCQVTSFILSVSYFPIYTKLTSQDFTTTNILKITGQSTGIGAASNDIVAEIGTVEFVPAAR